MNRDTFIDHRRATNAKQGEVATLKNGEIRQTMAAINAAAKRFNFPNPYRRRVK